MRYKVGLVISILAGGIIGFFGVLVSVFADSSGMTELLVTILVILVIYFVICGVLGLVFPNYSWEWGLLTGGPGVLFLAFYMMKELNVLYLLYMVLIIIFACFGGWCGSTAMRHRRKQQN